MQFKSFMEALKGKQHKIDKNKNGEIDAHDFKLLRKEEQEIEESEERMARADYKVSPSGRKSHKEIVFNSGEEKENEKEEMKEEMTDAQMKKREEIVKSMKKDMAGFKDRYGDKAKNVMYATATKMAMKEEAEELDEKSDQAKQNKTMKNMMDASRGARYKLNNPVPDAEPKHKTARAHNVAIGRALRSEEKKDDVPFDGPYTKAKPETKDKSGAVHSPMSRAKHLAKMAMKKQMKEDIDRLFEAKEKTEYDFEGDMARGQLQSIANNAQKVHDMLKDNDNLPEWVQSKITLAEDYISTVSNYMMSEIDEQAPVAPVPGMKFKDHAVMVNGKNRVVINRKNIDNYTKDGYKEVRPGQKLKEDEEVKFSYTELMMMLEYESKDGRYIHKGTYGGNYVDPEGADDADDKKPNKQPAVKRGRGRPAGAKSGARSNLGTSKLHK